MLALPSLRLKGHYLAMATLGFGELMTLAFAEAEPVTGGVDGFGGIPFPALGPFEIGDAASLYWLVWAVVGIALLAAYNVTSTAARARHARAARQRARAPRRAASTSSASRCGRSS